MECWEPEAGCATVARSGICMQGPGVSGMLSAAAGARTLLVSRILTLIDELNASLRS